MNTIVLMGRLTGAPELRHTANQVPVVSFTLAVDRDYTPKGQEKQTDFINIVAWRQLAEFVAKYFDKGQRMALMGTLQMRKFTDKEGNNRTAFEVIAEHIYFADSKKDYGGSCGGEYTGTDSGYYRDKSPSNVAPPPPQDFEEITDDGEPLPF